MLLTLITKVLQCFDLSYLKEYFLNRMNQNLDLLNVKKYNVFVHPVEIGRFFCGVVNNENINWNKEAI